MTIEGKKVICDRCGAEIFLKRTGTKETDGGWTKWDTFEPLPDGWETFGSMRIKHKMLCPDCNAELNELLNGFESKENNK